MRQYLPVLLMAGYKSLQKNAAYSTHVGTQVLPTSKPGIPLKDVLQVLNEYSNLSLAASWDNVGLLIEPIIPKQVSHILLTIDLTEDVVEEAIKQQTDLIISYHPPIFAPLKSITRETWKGRITAQCLGNNIAVYSPHTSIDAMKGGVNDWLATAFFSGLQDWKPIQVVNEPNSNKGETGYGRLCTLNTPITIDTAVNLVKGISGLQHLKLARARQPDQQIQTVALCAGSGTTVLKGVRADLYLTGEMLHHDILDAVHSNTHVILMNHSDSERGFLKIFASTLREALNKKELALDEPITVSISETDKDPLTVV